MFRSSLELRRERRTMRIARILAFTGPNVWSRNRVIEVSLAPEAGSADSCEAWRDRCIHLCDAWRAASVEPTTIVNDLTHLFESLANADHPARAFLDLALKLQALAGTPVDRGWIDIEPGPA